MIEVVNICHIVVSCVAL